MNGRMIAVGLSLLLCISFCSCTNKKQDRIRELINEGWKLDSLHNFKGSIAIYNEVLSMDAENYMALGLRGKAKAERGDTLGAIADLSQSIQIHPTIFILISKAWVLSIAKPMESLKCLRFARQLDTADARPIAGLMNYYCLVSPVKDSAIYYSSINITIDTQYQLNYLFALENIYLRFDDPDKLILVSDRIIAIDSSYAYAYNNKGYAKLQKNDFVGALTDIKKSLSLDSKNSYAYKNLGLLYIKQNKIDTACFYLGKARQLHYKEQYDNAVDSLLNKYCKNK